MHIVLGFLLIMGLLFVTAVLKGWVLSILWGWFIVPIFGLPLLGIVPAIGVSLALSYTINGVGSTKSGDTGSLVGTLVGPFIVLLFGWVVHQFMPVVIPAITAATGG
jgi:uncharacterized protein YqgC (DUF456 family)